MKITIFGMTPREFWDETWNIWAASCIVFVGSMTLLLLGMWLFTLFCGR
jgi:hypothetical protein